MKTFKEFMVDEAKTIGLETTEPNQEINPVEPGDGEDPRLVKIRQFKGTVQDYAGYWEDRIKENI
jgi:hypothetical protein